MQALIRILVICIFAVAALNGVGAEENNFQKAKRAYDDNKYAAAIKLLIPMAKAGNPKAQVLLGRIYDMPDGRPGVKKDKTKAQFWFEKAVKQDYTQAFRELGFHLVGTAKNPKRGYRLLKMAAERGDAQAQWGLGLYLSSSNWGLPEDRTAARKWLLRAIEQKYAHAAAHLLLMYRADGDYVEAYKWDIIGQFLTTKGSLILPDIRERMTESQIAESQRRAKAWLKAHGKKP